MNRKHDTAHLAVMQEARTELNRQADEKGSSRPLFHDSHVSVSVDADIDLEELVHVIADTVRKQDAARLHRMMIDEAWTVPPSDYMPSNHGTNKDVYPLRSMPLPANRAMLDDRIRDRMRSGTRPQTVNDLAPGIRELATIHKIELPTYIFIMTHDQDEIENGDIYRAALDTMSRCSTHTVKNVTAQSIEAAYLRTMNVVKESDKQIRWTELHEGFRIALVREAMDVSPFERSRLIGRRICQLMDRKTEYSLSVRQSPTGRSVPITGARELSNSMREDKREFQVVEYRQEEEKA